MKKRLLSLLLVCSLCLSLAVPAYAADEETETEPLVQEDLQENQDETPVVSDDDTSEDVLADETTTDDQGVTAERTEEMALDDEFLDEVTPASADEAEEVAEVDPEVEAYEASLGSLTVTSANAYTPAEQQNLLTAEDTGHAYEPETTDENAEAETAEYEEGVVLFARKEGGVSLFAIDDTDEKLADLGLTDIEEVWRPTEDEDSVSMFGIGESETVWYSAQIDGDVLETVEALNELSAIEAAEPNYLYSTDSYGEPTEVEKGKWENANIANMSMMSSWSLVYKDTQANPGAGVVVAVIDTGVDYTHVDLKSNMWVNEKELNGTPGVDDDGNGYIDDIYGINATITNPASNAKGGDPQDDNGHGTHVAGIIGMTCNGEGGVGLAYGAKIMAIKAGQSTGTLDSASIVRAIKYAKAMGADVINMSFGGTGRSSMVEDALADAFSQCVLVASAGNDALPTTDAPDDFIQKEDIYPAGYTYVLGVMATDTNGSLASFSNWDYYSDANAEYELTAPGVDIYSTLPGDRYGTWSGTSMAAPCVAAAAAILRGYYKDKDTYSSRFIMGQLASASTKTTSYVDKTGKAHTYTALSLYESLTKLPEPNLSVSQVFALDNVTTGTVNDGDSVVDAGETIDLGIQVRNQWGLTGDITVTANATSVGGVANPYVTFETDTVTLGAAGTFANVDNGYVWNDGELVNVTNPIRFKLADDTPNDTEICINLTITTTNGWDTTDTATYTVETSFTFRVQNGRAIKGWIEEDTTLSSDYYWIIENAVLIKEGVTVTVEPGTQIQFWSSDYEDAYGGKTMAYIKNSGTLNMIGTEENPIELFPGAGFEQYCVEIAGSGVETLQYCEIVNPRLGYTGQSTSGMVDTVDHCDLTQNGSGLIIRYLDDGKVTSLYAGSIYWAWDSFYISTLSNSALHEFRNDIYNNMYHISVKTDYGNLYDRCNITFYPINSKLAQTNTTILGSNQGGSSITTFAAMPTANPTYLKPVTYDGAESKYVFVEPYNYVYARALMQAVSATLDGRIACINDKEEEDFLYAQLTEMAESTRTEDDTGYIYRSAFVDYTYDINANSWGWGDSSTYTLSASFSRNTPYSSYPYGYLSLYSYPTYQNNYLGSLSRSYSSSCYYILEFPANCSDEEIQSALNDFDYYSWKKAYYTPYTTNCAILNPTYDTNTDHWTLFTAPSYTGNYTYNLYNNYWGTENTHLINRMIVDADDFAGTLDDIDETPILTLESESLADIYPFVTQIWLTDSTGHEVSSDVAPGSTYTVHVTFNRDMDTTVDPMITYGPADPYTDYSVSGKWTDARTWEGTTTVSTAATAGTMYFRAKGGRAASDHWLVCGTDQLRFAFDVSVTAAQSLNLSAYGGVNQVELSWWQNDYKTLAGYNIYRSTKETSGFAKLNTSVVTGKSYTDTTVSPGVTYYYYFEIVGTDDSTMGKSNVASATPKDNVAPVVTHTAVTTGTAGMAISLAATVTDNIGVSAVKVFYRIKGTEDYTERSLELNAAVANRYIGIIPAEVVTGAGVEYYLAAYDGDGNVAYSGSAERPFTVTVDTSLVLYGVSNPNFTAGSTVTLIGANMTAGLTVTIGNTQAADVQFISDTELTFTAPDLEPGSYTLTVSDGEKNVSLDTEVIYHDSQSYLELRQGVEAISGETLELPLYLGATGTVTSFYAEIAIPSNLFESTITVEGGTANYANGVLKISSATSSSIDTSQAVATITLTPKAVSETTIAALTIQVGRINGAAVQSAQGVSINIQPNFNLTATVKYYNGNGAVSGITVSGGGKSGTTDENGQVTLSGITVANVTVTAQRVDSTVSTAITANDATLVLQHTVGSITLNENQQLAGDMNNDGTVNEADAAIILQMVVGKRKTQSWTFSPTYKSMNLRNTDTNVSFTAILKGDVDGSWKEAAQ